MAIFGNNSLRPEEKVGGFEAGVNDSGLFSLNEMEEYPGILPNFEFEEQSVTSIIFGKEGKEYNFQIPKLELTPKDKVKPIIKVNLDEDVEEFEEGESFFKTQKKELEESDLKSYDNKLNIDSFNDEYGGEKYNFSKEENLDNRFNIDNEESEFVDNELKSILENSIGRKNNKKGKPTLDDLKYDEISENYDNEKLNNVNNDAIEELQNETMNAFFDFSSINADKPSQFDLIEEEEVKIEEEVKKKRKKIPFWLFSLYLLAGALVLTSLFALVFWKVINKKFNIDGKQDSTKIEKVINPLVKKEKKTENKKESRHTALVAENDDVKVELKVEIKPEKDTDEIHKVNNNLLADDHGHTKDKENSHKNTKDEHSNVKSNDHSKSSKDNKLHLHSSDDKTKIESKITIKDKKEHNEATHEKDETHKVKKEISKKSDYNINEKTKVSENKHSDHDEPKSTNELKKETKKEIKENKIKEKKNSSSESNEIAKVNNIDNKIKSETFIDAYKNEKIEDNKNNEEEDKPEFSVQIYSTLSKSDAQDMLKKLTSYGINTGFIVTQTVRDEVWYRVRYGKFNTKDEAKNNANKFGFNQIWIDRVK